MAELTTLWEARSLAEAGSVQVIESNLQAGDPYIIEIDLSLPLGWAFDLAGAEQAFAPFTPDGLRLVDVEGVGSNLGRIRYEVLDPESAQAAGAAPAMILGLVALVASFIARHWLAITIAGFALTAIVASIRGISVLRPITEPIKQDILVPLLIGGGLLLAFSLSR